MARPKPFARRNPGCARCQTTRGRVPGRRPQQAPGGRSCRASRHDWNANDKSAACPRLALDVDLAPVGANDERDNAEAQTHTRCLPRKPLIDAIEAPKDSSL